MSGDDGREWEVGWEGHDRAQRLRMARLPLDEKLQWLEDAHRLVRHLKRPDPVLRTPLDEPADGAPHGPPAPPAE